MVVAMYTALGIIYLAHLVTVKPDSHNGCKKTAAVKVAVAVTMTSVWPITLIIRSKRHSV